MTSLQTVEPGVAPDRRWRVAPRPHVNAKDGWLEDMTNERRTSEFPEHADENRRIWDENARWWDDRIGDGNDFQTLLIEPATERLLDVSTGDTILDVASGAGRFARRMATLGAHVVAFDCSAEFIECARERTSKDAQIE